MKKKFGARQILSVITFILIAIVVWNMRHELASALDYLADTNIIVILLLIPEQLLMYFCAGEMFFSYMSAKKNAKKIANSTLVRIALELNFVNHAVPSGGVSGLGYIAWRLKPYGATPGQTSFMYVLRYAITSFANQAQTLIAIVALLIMGTVAPENRYMLFVVGAISLAVIAVIIVGMFLIGKRKALNFAARQVSKLVNFVAQKLSFGHKKEVLKEEVVKKFCNEISDDYEEARKNKKMLRRPMIWGVVYSFLEVATYWIVGISMGHPELLPQIMVAEAVGSVLGAVIPTPGGAGGYEASMAGVMWALGVDLGLATAVVVTTRVIVLVGTIASGYGFYQHAIAKIGKVERKEIAEINDGKI